MKIKFMPLLANVPEYVGLTVGREYEVTKSTIEGYHVFDDGGLARVVRQRDTLEAGDKLLVTEVGSFAVRSSVVGRKDDGGKLDMTLFDDMPRALEAVVEVMQWAITKKQPVPYDRGSWLGVHPDRYRAAIKRHDSSACKQATATEPARFQRDAETSLLHLAHEACSALFALELTLREMESHAE